jgi:peptidoglycan/xylan/chitin deacetylase (PgdA/CDA1 family)
VTHPALPYLSSDEQQLEMTQAQRRLEEMLPRVVPVVAYPFGLYDRATLSAAASAGLQAGVTMQARAVARGDLALALPRVGVSEDWCQSAISLRLNAGMRPLFRARAGTHPHLPVYSPLSIGGA